MKRASDAKYSSKCYKKRDEEGSEEILVAFA